MDVATLPRREPAQDKEISLIFQDGQISMYIPRSANIALAPTLSAIPLDDYMEEISKKQLSESELLRPVESALDGLLESCAPRRRAAGTEFYADFVSKSHAMLAKALENLLAKNEQTRRPNRPTVALIEIFANSLFRTFSARISNSQRAKLLTCLNAEVVKMATFANLDIAGKIAVDGSRSFVSPKDADESQAAEGSIEELAPCLLFVAVLAVFVESLAIFWPAFFHDLRNWTQSRLSRLGSAKPSRIETLQDVMRRARSDESLKARAPDFRKFAEEVEALAAYGGTLQISRFYHSGKYARRAYSAEMRKRGAPELGSTQNVNQTCALMSALLGNLADAISLSSSVMALARDTYLPIAFKHMRKAD